MSAHVAIVCRIVGETPGALLVDDGRVEAWIPKSMIRSRVSGAQGSVEIEIPEWLAEEKGVS